MTETPLTPRPPSARLLGDQIETLLDDINGVTLYRGRVGASPYDQQGQVINHAVLYESPGHRHPGRAGSTRDRLTATFQVTCVGRDDDSCLWVVDRVTGALTGRLVQVPGRTRPRRVVEDDSNDVRTVIVDEDVSPPRHYVPLLFRIHT